MAAPNLAEIENGIYKLEHEESSKAGYILLSALYICRDKMLGLSAPQSQVMAYSEAPAPVEQLERYGDSDFLRTVQGRDPGAAWAVIDELMETLRVVNPRAYESVMRKMQRL